MNIAIPQWQGRVSPVFDSAAEVLVTETSADAWVRRAVVPMAGNDPLARVRSLKRCGAQVLICGAISRPMQIALVGAGVEVIANKCGEVGEVWTAFLEGRLNEKAFQMPGTSGERLGSSAKAGPPP